MHCRTLALILFITACFTATACGDNVETTDPLDAAVADVTDAAVDAAVDAPIDAPDTIPRPPLPMPSPCDTCAGFGCDTVCADAGVDAP